MNANASTISDAQLDPALFGVSAEAIAGIPLAVLIAHRPDLAAQMTQQAQNQAQPSSTSLGILHPITNTSAPIPPPSYLPATNAMTSSSTDTSSTAISSSTGEDEVEPEIDDTIPSRPLSSFEHPERMLWNYEDAKNMKEGFSRVDCTRNPDGTCIKKHEIAKLSKAVAFVCAPWWDMEIHDYLQGRTRNLTFFRSNYLHLLIDAAKGLEKKFPILSWCSYHYKAIKWIEYHLKFHNEQIAKMKRASAALNSTSTSSTSNSNAAGSSGAGKNRKTKRAAESDLKPTKTAKKPKKKHSLPEVDDEIFSEDDDADEESTTRPSKPAPKSKSKFVAPPLNMRSDDDIEDEDEDIVYAAKPSVASPAPELIPKQMIIPKQTMLIPKRVDSASNTATTSAALASTTKPSIRIPNSAAEGEPASKLALLASASASSKASGRATLVLPTLKAAPNSTASTMAEKVDHFQKTATATAIGTTVEEIKAALPRYGALGEIDLVRSALQTLEVAQACGLDPGAAGDLNFMNWLERLEELQEPPEDMDEDERADEMGVQFGHKAIGTWSYHTPLKDITNWGRVANACRLLSALLRIWSMAKTQMKNVDSDPLVHNHIKQVCDNIQEAFKAPSNQKAKAPRSAAERGATASSSSGKVSEARLRRLGKKLSIPLLEKAGISIPSKATRADVADMLVASWKSGKVTITAKELQDIEPGKQKAD